MSLTYARVPLGEGILGSGLRFKFLDIAFDSSYPTGGEVMSGIRAALGFNSITGMVDMGVGSQGPFKFRYLPTTDALQVLRGGVAEYTYTQGDIKGSVNTDKVGAGNYMTIGTNGNLISTLAASDNTTAFTINLQPDIPRNIGIIIKDTSGGNVNGNAAAYVIVGLFRGAAQTETISFSVTELTTMSNGNIAAKYSTKPFDSITSITPSAAQPTGFEHGVGPGSKLGLPVATDQALEADLVKLFKNAADLAITGLYGTGDTVNFGVLADGDDVSVIYRAGGGEVQNTASLTGIVQRFALIGT